MTDNEQTIRFAGTSAFDQPSIPAWFSASGDLGGENTPTFGEAFRSLITADTTDVAWKVPDSFGGGAVTDMNDDAPDGVEFFADADGSLWATTRNHNAVFSPELLMDQDGSDDAVDALLNIPTDSYALVNPYDFYRPLEDALEEHGEGQNVFGEFRLYDRGAEVHGDIWFDTKSIDIPSGEGKYKFGIQTGYDFKGNRSLYANIIAQDTSCQNTLRQLASKKTRRHVSEEGEESMSVSEYETWWVDLLEKIDLVADEVTHVLQDASDLHVEFDVEDPADEDDLSESDPLQVPFGLEEFYRLAGVAHISTAIPEYLRDAAAKDTRQRSGTAPVHSMWHIHSGLTYALTHVYRGGERGTLLQYNEVAKDLLYNPSEMMSEVAQAFEAEQQSDEDDEETAFEAGAVATVQRSSERISEMREEYGERQQRIEQVLQADEAT
jgi:hypothetical protein